MRTELESDRLIKRLIDVFGHVPIIGTKLSINTLNEYELADFRDINSESWISISCVFLEMHFDSIFLFSEFDLPCILPAYLKCAILAPSNYNTKDVIYSYLHKVLNHNTICYGIVAPLDTLFSTEQVQLMGEIYVYLGKNISELLSDYT